MKLQPKEILNSSPVSIIGSINSEGEPNAMVTTSVRFISLDPLLVSWAIDKSRYTLENLKENKEFTINIPGKNLINELFYVGTVSYRDEPDKIKKSNLKTVESTKVKPPLIEGTLAGFECKVKDLVKESDHYLVIGKVLETHEGEEGLPLYHLGGKNFLQGGKMIQATPGKKTQKKSQERMKKNSLPYSK